MSEADRKIVQAAAQVLLGATMSLIQGDPHQWSTRPCGTCRAIIIIIGEPFGCYLYTQQKVEEKKA